MLAVDKLFKKINPKFDDDAIDRFNYIYSPVLLGTFAVTIVAKQYVGQPLQCWVPAEFQSQWEKYSEDYCFVENTYFVRMHEKFPNTTEERKSRELQYYQWVPFILALQMILFMLPKVAWNALNWKSGLCISDFIQRCRFSQRKEKKKKELFSSDKVVVQEARHLYRTARNQRTIRYEKENPDNDKVSDYYVTSLYLGYKLINLCVCLLQLYFLNEVLAPNYSFWGFGILRDLFNNRRWQQSGHFPRVTFCDVKIREQGGRSISHTFQCVLMINMFNEKIFIFLWFWLIFLAVLDALNFVYWLYLALMPSASRNFIASFIKASGRKISDPLKLDEFIRENLSKDGITTLRLINSNTGYLITNDIIGILWDQFYNKKPDSEEKPRTNYPSIDKLDNTFAKFDDLPKRRVFSETNNFFNNPNHSLNRNSVNSNQQQILSPPPPQQQQQNQENMDHLKENSNEQQYKSPPPELHYNDNQNPLKVDIPMPYFAEKNNC